MVGLFSGCVTDTDYAQLTYLLQYSLGGNSKTLMFVMISPLQAHLSETLTSLKFATKVRHIMHNAEVTADMPLGAQHPYRNCKASIESQGLKTSEIERISTTQNEHPYLRIQGTVSGPGCDCLSDGAAEREQGRSYSTSRLHSYGVLRPP